MWGTLATCGRLAIGLPVSTDNVFALEATTLRDADTV
jgi:hypothetical protein